MRSHHEVCSDAGAAAPAPVAPVPPRPAVVPVQPSRLVVEVRSSLQRPAVGGGSTVVLCEAILLCSEVNSTIVPCHRRSQSPSSTSNAHCHRRPCF